MSTPAQKWLESAGLSEPQACDQSAEAWARFVGIEPDEPNEIIVFAERGDKAMPVTIAYPRGPVMFARLVNGRGEDRLSMGTFTMVNRIDEAIADRYVPDKWAPTVGGHAKDEDIVSLRCLYVDVDAVRKKGISSTDAQLAEAFSVAEHVYQALAENFGAEAIGRGMSGNGFALFVALEPTRPTRETTTFAKDLLERLARGLSTEAAKIDTTTYNPGRLCPAFGTWKRKGFDARGRRPHRRSWFLAPSDVRRVALDAVKP
jgi:hypothetical protein